MPHWLIKSALHRTISMLPGSHWWNELLQSRISKTLELSAGRFEQRLEYCQRHVEDFVSLRPHLSDDFSVFELGTGWHPVVPACLYLCGASPIWTVDIASHLSSERVEQSLRMICEYEARGTLQRFVRHIRPERMTRLRKVAEGAGTREPRAVLEELNIHALVRDAQDTGLDAGLIDLFVSDSVIEYIPRLVLANMLAEFRRIAKAEAIHSHFINLSDQFAQFDRSITEFNFLKYSDRQWKWLDSPLTSKSRLRISDYRDLFAQAGCPILREQNMKGTVGDLERVRLAPRFQSYSQDDLLVLRSWLLAQLRPVAVGARSGAA